MLSKRSVDTTLSSIEMCRTEHSYIDRLGTLHQNLVRVISKNTRANEPTSKAQLTVKASKEGVRDSDLTSHSLVLREEVGAPMLISRRNRTCHCVHTMLGAKASQKDQHVWMDHPLDEIS